MQVVKDGTVYAVKAQKGFPEGVDVPREGTFDQVLDWCMRVSEKFRIIYIACMPRDFNMNLGHPVETYVKVYANESTVISCSVRENKETNEVFISLSSENNECTVHRIKSEFHTCEVLQRFVKR